MKDAALHPVLRVLVHGHVLLVLGAVAQLWWVDRLFHFHSDPRLLGVVALATFSAYGGMRLLRMRVPGLATNAMMGWYRSNALLLHVLVIVSGLAALAFAWPLRHLVFHALWLPMVLAAGYTLPLAMTGGRPTGLRRTPFLKAVIIGFVWASIVVLLPGADERNAVPYISDDVWWVATIWTCYFTAIAITFDIRDLPHDLPSLRTMPQVLGIRGAQVLSILLLLPLLLTLVLLLVAGYHPIEAGWREPRIDLSILFPALGVVWTGVVIARAHTLRAWWYWDLLLDGSLTLLPLLAFAGGLR